MINISSFEKNSIGGIRIANFAKGIVNIISPYLHKT
jgi:hypothetical protein